MARKSKAVDAPAVDAPAVDAPVVDAPVVEKVAKVGVGSFCKDKILNSVWTNAEILEEVKRVFPSAKTTYACIAWYRSDLRSKGLIGPKVSAKKVVETQAEVAETQAEVV